MQNAVPVEVMFIGLVIIGLGTGGIGCLKWMLEEAHADVLSSANRHEGPKQLAGLREMVRTSQPGMNFFAKYVFVAGRWLFVAAGVAGLIGYLTGFTGVNVFELIPK